MYYYIAPSPLVKIFLPEWHDRLQDNPELIHDTDTPFTFTVNSGTRAIKIAFNTPQQVMMSDQREAANVFRWLVGGSSGAESRDTDIYGIVPFNPQMDIVKTFDEMAMLDDFTSDDPAKVAKAKKLLAERKKETSSNVRNARSRVTGLSEERIKRAIRLSHNNLIRQWQHNEENKLGKYPPSIAEMLGSHAIMGEIAASKAKGAELKKRASEMMNSPVI